jgi:uncharacterized protein (TIGR03437 family)
VARGQTQSPRDREAHPVARHRGGQAHNGTVLLLVTSVTFGGVAAVFKAASDIKIQAITPAGPPGNAAVVVRTADGRTATSPMPSTYT